MELGELVAPPLPDLDTEAGCPFEHEPPPGAEIKNELGGIGTELGKNLIAGKGVNASIASKSEEDPRTNGIRAVVIKVNGRERDLSGTPLRYPVTCAAHHLIPAQESLKKHPILDFMCQKGQTQDFRNGKEAAPEAVGTSKVWGSVGYNVNGANNGVWLPGNYAVGAGKGGIEVWKSRSSDKRKTISDKEALENWLRAIDDSGDAWTPKSDPNENEEPQPESLAEALANAKMPEYALAGTNYDISTNNPKWAYVKAAMDHARGQFHDRHAKYSERVVLYLDKVSDVYVEKYEAAVSGKSKCQKCKDAKRPKYAPKDDKLVGPPKTLIARLVGASQFFRGHLSPPDPEQKLTVRTIFTSQWVSSWMDTKPAKKK
jgi:hypothetical protein